jgi:AmiR/NasT family two-component response regulator
VRPEAPHQGQRCFELPGQAPLSETDHLVERADHLQAALDSRAVIDQAKGILMERSRMTADQAFQALARISMESNTKVRDAAQRFVDTGEFRSP